MRVGFIGLGNVGGKLAGSLIRNRVDVAVHDLNPDLVAAFVAKGDSLSAWCRRNGITRTYAVACLKRQRSGPGARARTSSVIRGRAALAPHSAPR